MNIHKYFEEIITMKRKYWQRKLKFSMLRYNEIKKKDGKKREELKVHQHFRELVAQ